MKQKKRRRLIALLLTVVLVFGLIPGAGTGLRVMADEQGAEVASTENGVGTEDTDDAAAVGNETEAEAESETEAAAEKEAAVEAEDDAVNSDNADGDSAKADNANDSAKSVSAADAAKTNDSANADDTDKADSAAKQNDSAANVQKEEAATEKTADDVKVEEEELPMALEKKFSEPIQLQVGDLDVESNNSYLPIYSVYKYGYSEQLYYTEEIGDVTTISALSFYVTSSLADRQVQMYLTDTDLTALSKNAPISTANATKVYEGAAPFNETGWQKISFTEEYTHDPAKNLVVITVNETGSWTSGLCFSAYSADSDAICSLYDSRDGSELLPQTEGRDNSKQEGKGKNTILLDVTGVAEGALLTVTFKDGENELPQTVLRNRATELPYDGFQKDGYYISSWNTAADGSGVAYTGAKAVFTENTTLYAQWSELSTLTLKSGVEGMDDHIESFISGDSVVLTDNEWENEGYVLEGYNTMADGSGTFYPVGVETTFDESQVLYAVWIAARQIGEQDDDSYFLPINFSEEYGYSEQLYTAEEVGDWNYLTGVSFFITDFEAYEGYQVSANLNAPTGNNNSSAKAPAEVEVYLADVDFDSFRSDSFIISDLVGKEVAAAKNSAKAISPRPWVEVPIVIPDDATLVYSGPAPFYQEGWAKLAFDRGFTHDPEKNLVLIMVNAGGNYECGISFATYDTDYYSSCYACSDNMIEPSSNNIDNRAKYKNVIRLYGETAETKTITFNSNDDAEGKVEQSFIPDVPFKLPANFFISENHAFLGWNTKADGTGTFYESQETATFTENTTLYAQWREGILIGDLENTIPSFVDAPLPFAASTYGWSEQVYTPEEVGSVNVISEIAFYAESSQKTVNKVKLYMADVDMEAPMDSVIDPADATPVYVGTVSTNRSGWYFIELNGAYIHDPEKGLCLITVAESYGTTASNLFASFYDDDANGFSVCGVSTTEPVEPDDMGGSRFPFRSVLFLIGEEKEADAEITYMSNNGKNDSFTEPGYTGIENIIAGNTFEKRSYCFTGWNTKADGTGETYLPGDSVILDSSLTVYAQWAKASKVTFHTGVGDYTQYFVAGQPFTLEEIQTTNPKHTFVSWNTKKNGSGRMYEAEEEVIFFGNTNLYAIWSDDSAETVTYTEVYSKLPTKTTDGNTMFYLGSDGNHYSGDGSSYQKMEKNEWLLPKLVSYIDGYGEEIAVSAMPLTGAERVLTGGWYVVDRDITFTHGIMVTGEVNLILADGKTMRMDVVGPYAITDPVMYYEFLYDDRNDHVALDPSLQVSGLSLSGYLPTEPSELFIYGQKASTGRLDIHADSLAGMMVSYTGITGGCIDISGSMSVGVVGYVFSLGNGTVKIQNDGPSGCTYSIGYSQVRPRLARIDTCIYMFGGVFFDSGTVDIKGRNGIGAPRYQVSDLGFYGGTVRVEADDTAISVDEISFYAQDAAASFYADSYNANGVYFESPMMDKNRTVYTEDLETDDEIAVLDGKKLSPLWPFTDVAIKPGNWVYEGIAFVYQKGIMSGDADTDGDGFTTFNPKGTLTRGQFITTLYRLAGEPEVEGDLPFTDVKKNAFYYDPIRWALANEITTGTSATTFSPKDNITRQDMAVLLMRFADYMGYDTSNRSDIKSMPDYSKVKSYARNAFSWANAEGIITGKDIKGEKYLDPRANATRQECATILMRFHKRYMQQKYDLEAVDAKAPVEAIYQSIPEELKGCEEE